MEALRKEELLMAEQGNGEQPTVICTGERLSVISESELVFVRTYALSDGLPPLLALRVSSDWDVICVSVRQLAPRVDAGQDLSLEQAERLYTVLGQLLPDAASAKSWRWGPGHAEGICGWSRTLPPAGLSTPATHYSHQDPCNCERCSAGDYRHCVLLLREA